MEKTIIRIERFSPGAEKTLIVDIAFPSPLNEEDQFHNPEKILYRAWTDLRRQLDAKEKELKEDKQRREALPKITAMLDKSQVGPNYKLPSERFGSSSNGDIYDEDYDAGYQTAQNGGRAEDNPNRLSGHERDTTYEDEAHYQWYRGFEDFQSEKL